MSVSTSLCLYDMGGATCHVVSHFRSSDRVKLFRTASDGKLGGAWERAMIDPEDGCQLQKAEAQILLLESLLLVALGIQ